MSVSPAKSTLNRIPQESFKLSRGPNMYLHASPMRGATGVDVEMMSSNDPGGISLAGSQPANVPSVLGQGAFNATFQGLMKQPYLPVSVGCTRT